MSSSLYGVLFDSAGGTQTATFLLKLLDKTPSDFGRYRDAYVTDEYIVIHTRCGGGIDIDRLYEPPFTTLHAESVDGLFPDPAVAGEVLAILEAFQTPIASAS